MIMSPKKIVGLTLIEVLVALAIVSIAMTAIIKSTSQNIRATSYLENKTIAAWVGEKVLNEIRVGLIKLPDTDTTKEKITMLGKDWHWQAGKEDTPNKHIKKIDVKVYAGDDVDETENVTPLITLEGYIYERE